MIGSIKGCLNSKKVNWISKMVPKIFWHNINGLKNTWEDIGVYFYQNVIWVINVKVYSTVIGINCGFDRVAYINTRSVPSNAQEILSAFP